MIDKKKLKKFLSSNCSLSIKMFVLDVLKFACYNQTNNTNYLIRISDLDIFQKDFIKFPDKYYIIDFIYLESLQSNIKDFYIKMLMDGFKHDSISNIYNSVDNFAILIEHGILLTDIEHLKIKRLKKLEKVKKRENDSKDIDINIIF